MANLCVNIDHIATLRQARRGVEPDPVLAVGIVEEAGSTGITVHLREDRRHIQDRDVELVRKVVRGHLNLEMASTRAMVDRAIELKPDISTLVPEKREEVTTEGGLDVVGQFAQVSEATARLMDAGISVSLFIDPVEAQIEAAVKCGAAEVEFHTGTYCNAKPGEERNAQLGILINACATAHKAGLIVNAGHGLNYHNVLPVAAIEGMRELNIGHSIMARAIFAGLGPAVVEMARLIELATIAPERYRSRP